MSRYTLSEAQKKEVNKAIRYAKKFENYPYTLCGNQPPKNTINDKGPFWFSNEKPPEMNIIKKKGMNCVGLANLVRRYMGLQIPGKVIGQKLTSIVKLWPGSTSAWFHYLKTQKRLEKIDFNKVYPKGTLLLEDFNPKNSGHVAITINSSKKGLLESKIIHALNWRNNEPKKLFRKVSIEKLKESERPYKLYTHICLPQNWLLKN